MVAYIRPIRFEIRFERKNDSQVPSYASGISSAIVFVARMYVDIFRASNQRIMFVRLTRFYVQCCCCDLTGAATITLLLIYSFPIVLFAAMLICVLRVCYRKSRNSASTRVTTPVTPDGRNNALTLNNTSVTPARRNNVSTAVTTSVTPVADNGNDQRQSTDTCGQESTDQTPVAISFETYSPPPPSYVAATSPPPLYDDAVKQLETTCV